MRHGYMIKILGERLARAKKRKGEVGENLVKQILQDIKDLDETAPPTRLFELIAEGIPVEAHNAFFERCIWNHVCEGKMDWPAVAEDQWMCSAAKASMHALPRDLERATKEMCPDEEKDMEGRRVMLKLSKPAKPIKAEPDREWNEEPKDLRTLWAYCDQDVASEEALSASLDDLPPYEFKLWQMDQRMNLRGFYSDHDLANKAIAISQSLTDQLNAELGKITHGALEKASQRARIKDWLNDDLDRTEEAGNLIPGTGAPVLDRLLQDPTLRGSTAHAVIDIVRAVNRTSLKKYQAMLDRSDAGDQRIRDMMMYHGAGTGRWSGKGVQPHNFPRGFLKDMEGTCRELLECSLSDLLDILEYEPKELMDILSWALRGALCAPEGRVLYVADYAAIEARVLVWLAGDEQALQVFRDGKDIYKDMACSIYDIPYEAVDGEHRRMGKQAILGLGYQMGAPKFWDTIAGYVPQYKGVNRFKQPVEFLMLPGTEILGGIKKMFKQDEAMSDALKYGFKLTETQEGQIIRAFQLAGNEDFTNNVDYFLFVRNVVIKYRERYALVKKMWNNQNGCAIAAVEEPGERFEANNVTWFMNDNDFLCCELPSGRLLYYRSPELDKNKFGKQSLYYWSIDAMTKQWRRTGTYGGKLVENITQAVARDLMADAMLRIDEDPTYDLLASVHDELICEADEGTGDVEEFENLMAGIQPWAEGCPVAAEGWSGLRYRK